MTSSHRIRRRATGLLGAVLMLGMQACGGETLPCTLVGVVTGVVVEIPRTLYVPTGSVGIEVCDDRGCAEATQRLDRVPGGPTDRLAEASFHALGRSFDPGPVTVTVRLRDVGDRLVATRHQLVELVRRYPNGKRCDGDGFVGGHLAMEPGDRL